MAVELNYPHVEVPVDGPARLARWPRVRVAQVAMDYLAHGWSVDEICRQYPHLLPAEVHAAMAYYFDHREAIDREIEAEVVEAEAARRGGPSPIALRALGLRRR